MYIYIHIYIIYITFQQFIIKFSSKYLVTKFFMIFGFCFGKSSFVTVTTTLWKSESPVSNTQVLGKSL